MHFRCSMSFAPVEYCMALRNVINFRIFDFQAPTKIPNVIIPWEKKRLNTDQRWKECNSLSLYQVESHASENYAGYWNCCTLCVGEA